MELGPLVDTNEPLLEKKQTKKDLLQLILFLILEEQKF